MRTLFTLGQRVKIYAIALVGTIFLTIYNQLVCPFLESRSFFEVFSNLVLVFIFQLLLREILIRSVHSEQGSVSVGRSYYRMMTLSWLISGLAAVTYHEIFYHNIFPDQVLFTKPWPSDYPWHSHLKVLSGYWFLGAGLLSQLELSLGEKYIRQYIRRHGGMEFHYSDMIASRITWGNFFYTFVPSMAILIMVARYAVQDKIIPLAITAEIAYIGVVFITTALWAASLYGKILRSDTREIVEAIQKVGTGNFDVKLLPTRQDELGQVATGINEMAAGLVQRERIKESFGHFVSPEIAERFVKRYSEGKDMRGYGDRKMVAVLMCDIRSFSTISETMDPSDVARMLNTYFDHMVNAIESCGGLIDKFIGDAVMAIFGLLEEEGNPSIQAVKAAVAMRKALKEANRENRDLSLPELENGIGIHYGEVIASYLGSSSRLEFTVIGSTVNTAARLESKAKAPNPPVIISSAVAEAVKERFTVYGGKAVELKGVGSHRVYSIKEADRS